MRDLLQHTVRRIHQRKERVSHSHWIGCEVVSQSDIYGEIRGQLPLVVNVRRDGNFPKVSSGVCVSGGYTLKESRNAAQKLLKVIEAVPAPSIIGDICTRLNSLDGRAEANVMSPVRPG